MGKLRKFLIISLDDIALALAIVILTYIFLPDYFAMVTLITLSGLTIFLIAKYILVKPVLGEEGRISYDIEGKIGVVIKDIDGEGTIMVHGEKWKARGLGNKRIPRGRLVRVIRRKGLLAIVDEVNQEDLIQSDRLTK